MAMLEEKEFKPVGKLEPIHIQDHELVQELHHRLDTLSVYTEYVAETKGNPQVQNTWREFQQQEEANIKHLKQRIADSIDSGVPQDEF